MQANQAGWRKQMCEFCEQTSKWMSKRPSTLRVYSLIIRLTVQGWMTFQSFTWFKTIARMREKREREGVAARVNDIFKGTEKMREEGKERGSRCKGG